MGCCLRDVPCDVKVGSSLSLVSPAASLDSFQREIFLSLRPNQPPKSCPSGFRNLPLKRSVGELQKALWIGRFRILLVRIYLQAELGGELFYGSAPRGLSVSYPCYRYPVDLFLLNR